MFKDKIAMKLYLKELRLQAQLKRLEFLKIDLKYFQLKYSKEDKKLMEASHSKVIKVQKFSLDQDLRLLNLKLEANSNKKLKGEVS